MMTVDVGRSTNENRIHSLRKKHSAMISAQCRTQKLVPNISKVEVSNGSHALNIIVCLIERILRRKFADCLRELGDDRQNEFETHAHVPWPAADVLELPICV